MKTIVRSLGFLVVSCLALAVPLRSFAAEAREPGAFVDESGVMRWTATREEVALFGVNYTTPFAHAFRAHQRLGLSLEAAIDADVYHIARLRLGVYRVHVWDREISDPDGNLVVNEHVRAFDYLLAKLKERGIKIVLTPLQFGNAAYPEGGVPLNGFSSKYGKQGCLENRESWPLQERYLAQFASHVNPHTGLAYKDDPDVIAFEICNEPGHFDYASTLEYINRMTQAIRDTGARAPVFYNMSHGLPVFAAYLDANVQGGTFQWYPANLVANHEQRGNFLPYVDEYPIPFANDARFQKKTKIVYEFDAADIGRSYIYPAIARTYRKAGMQIAAMFAYDPMAIAPFNTEYQTHYMNLAYAPSKALGLLVAAEAFRRAPLHHDYGRFPNNTSFAGVRVSYADDLAELVTDELFYHSNATTTPPPSPQKLVHVAGYGSSPVVNYPGRGAYFLDRIHAGVWRLEVMPDAIWVRDPFEKPSPTKHVSRIAWNEWPMRIDLPDLGANFAVVGINDGNSLRVRAEANTVRVRPGTYQLVRAGLAASGTADEPLAAITSREFFAPPASLDKTYVLHQPIVEASAGHDLRITATVASPKPIGKVELIAYLPQPPVARAPVAEQPGGGGEFTRAQPGRFNAPGVGQLDTGGARTITMTAATGFDYVATIPAELMNAGTFRYHIAVRGTDGVVMTFPSEIAAFPTDWDFTGESWTARVVPARAPVLLFDAAADSQRITADDRDVRYDLVPSDRPGTSAMNMLVRDLTPREHDVSWRFFFKEKIRGRAMSDITAATKLVLFGRSATDQPCLLQLALMTEGGVAYGATVMVAPQTGAWSVPISALKKVRSPNIPHGYPVFIPFWSEIATNTPLALTEIECVLVSVGPGIAPADFRTAHGVQVERIWLE